MIETPATAPDVREREAALAARLRSLPSIVVAYSGGVDSAYLAWVATRELGSRALCVTAASPSYPECHRAMALAIARDFGLRHEIIQTDELERPEYRANAGDRCYYCKHELFSRLSALAREQGFAAVADGTNADDRGDYRPGRRAAREFGVVSPLDEAGLTKQDIRTLSHEAGLPTWDEPASACLSSRVPHFSEVTEEKLRAIEQGAPVDLVFQSIGGTQKTNESFGVSLSLLREAMQAARSLKRGTLGDNVMYFETGQGSSLSAGAHHGCDQQTLEARAYGVARAYEPLLVNTVVGFIGPEYLFDGKQIIRAGLEDHFCGKLLGVPLGVDVCYTNHAEADQDDMDTLLTLLGAAGVTYIMGVPGADDVMLNYQSTSFHDALYLREVMGLKRAPEFEAWLEKMGIAGADGRLIPAPQTPLLALAKELG